MLKVVLLVVACSLVVIGLIVWWALAPIRKEKREKIRREIERAEKQNRARDERFAEEQKKADFQNYQARVLLAIPPEGIIFGELFTRSQEDMSWTTQRFHAGDCKLALQEWFKMGALIETSGKFFLTDVGKTVAAELKKASARY